MNAPFTPGEWAALERAFAAMKRKAVSLAALFGLTVLQVLALLMIYGVEFSLFYEIFDQIKGALVPGEESSWSVSLLALTGTLMLIGYYVRIKQDETALPARFVRRCVDMALPLYAIGGGLCLAAIVYFDGADILFRVVPLVGDFFADAPAPSGVPVVDQIASYFPMVFAAACGGLLFVNLFIGHFLMSSIWENIQKIIHGFADIKAANADMQTIRDRAQRYADAYLRLACLKAVDHETAEVALANAIRVAISEAVRPHEEALRDHKLYDGQALRFGPPRTNVNLKELERLLAALRGITVDSILKAIRGQ